MRFDVDEVLAEHRRPSTGRWCVAGRVAVGGCYWRRALVVALASTGRTLRSCRTALHHDGPARADAVSPAGRSRPCTTCRGRWSAPAPPAPRPYECAHGQGPAGLGRPGDGRDVRHRGDPGPQRPSSATGSARCWSTRAAPAAPASTWPSTFVARSRRPARPRSPAVRHRRLRPARGGPVQPGQVHLRRGPRRQLRRRARPGRPGRSSTALVDLPGGSPTAASAKYGDDAAAVLHRADRAGHGRDAAGGRRREADLPRLLVRHPARRGLRPAVPDQGPRPGARRRGRPAGGPGRRRPRARRTGSSGRSTTSPTGAPTTPARARSRRRPGRGHAALDRARTAPVRGERRPGRPPPGWVLLGAWSPPCTPSDRWPELAARYRPAQRRRRRRGVRARRRLHRARGPTGTTATCSTPTPRSTAPTRRADVTVERGARPAVAVAREVPAVRRARWRWACWAAPVAGAARPLPERPGRPGRRRSW